MKQKVLTPAEWHKKVLAAIKSEGIGEIYDASSQIELSSYNYDADSPDHHLTINYQATVRLKNYHPQHDFVMGYERDWEEVLKKLKRRLKENKIYSYKNLGIPCITPIS